MAMSPMSVSVVVTSVSVAIFALVPPVTVTALVVFSLGAFAVCFVSGELLFKVVESVHHVSDQKAGAWW